MSGRTGLLLALSIAIVAVAVSGCAAPRPAPATRPPSPPSGSYKLVRPGTLTVGADTSFPPFETLQGNSVEGFDADIARAIGRELGVKVAFKSTPFDLLVQSLLRGGQIDVIVSALPITPTLRDRIDFSDPYLNVDQAVVMPVRSTLSTSIELKGRIVGVVAGTTGQKWAAANVKDASRVVAFDDSLAAFAALQAGNIDALITDAPVANYVLLDKTRGLRIVRTIKTGERYGIGIRKEDPALRDSVNDALRRIRASGEYDSIYKRWFGVPPS